MSKCQYLNVHHVSHTLLSTLDGSTHLKSSQHPYTVGTIISFILHIRKWRHREAKTLLKSHTVSTWVEYGPRWSELPNLGS